MNTENLQDIKGLTTEEVKKALKLYGYNELKEDKKGNALKTLFRVLSEPMLLLLLACGTVYLFLGDVKEALLLLFSICVVIGITFYQERKTEKTLEALKKIASPRALVIRNGEITRIPGREVVPGDIVVLHEGDRVTGDAVILSATNFFVDESMLTGESVGVAKTEYKDDIDTINPKTLQMTTGENTPYIFSSTLVIKGNAIGKVIKTGSEAQVGLIGSSIKNIEFKDSLLQKETNNIVRVMFLIALAVCTTVTGLNVLLRHDIIGGILSGLTVAMAMIPEEFPLILTIFLSLGAWRLSKINVLTRRIPIIETLGAVTTLCVDKTGTITQNTMKISDHYDVPETLIIGALFASKETPFDPMEIEIHRIARAHMLGNATKNYKLVKEYPMTNEVTAISIAWQKPDNSLIVGAKGAPESIMKLCHLNEDEIKKHMQELKEMTKEGLRVLGIAKAEPANLPEMQNEINFSFLGFIGFEDPVKLNVNKSVQECYDAGVKVMMLTGDFSGTALHVAKTIELENSYDVINGEELEKYSEAQLIERLNEGVCVFSRVKPLQKLKLVTSLIAKGEIVAMTGDGVNDSPALKESHVGIAMGKRGTDVAREASAIVLLDDDFNSIVKGIRQGRRIYENIKKAMKYVLAIHIPIAGMAMLPIALGMPTFFFPLHVIFLEFLIDPISTIIFEIEKPDKHIMKKPPRKLDERIFDKRTIILGLLQGGSVFLATWLIYFIALKEFSVDYARTLAFVTMIAANLSLVLINRSESDFAIVTLLRPNKALWFIYGLAITTLVAIIYTPQVAIIFKFQALSILDLAKTIIVGLICVGWLDLLKLKRDFFRNPFLA